MSPHFLAVKCMNAFVHKFEIERKHRDKHRWPMFPEPKLLEHNGCISQSQVSLHILIWK